MNCLPHATFPPPQVLGEPFVIWHILLQTRECVIGYLLGVGWLKVFPKRLNLLKYSTSPNFPTLFAVFILSDLRGSNSNLTLFLISTFTCFDRSLPVMPSLFPCSAITVFVSWILIGVPDGSSCDVLGAITVLHPIGDVIVGVCARSVSTCRPISALRPVSSDLLSMSEQSLFTFGTIESESQLDEPYMTTHRYVSFFWCHCWHWVTWTNVVVRLTIVYVPFGSEAPVSLTVLTATGTPESVASADRLPLFIRFSGGLKVQGFRG